MISKTHRPTISSRRQRRHGALSPHGHPDFRVRLLPRYSQPSGDQMPKAFHYVSTLAKHGLFVLEGYILAYAGPRYRK